MIGFCGMAKHLLLKIHTSLFMKAKEHEFWASSTDPPRLVSKKFFLSSIAIKLGDVSKLVLSFDPPDGPMSHAIALCEN